MSIYFLQKYKKVVDFYKKPTTPTEEIKKNTMKYSYIIITFNIFLSIKNGYLIKNIRKNYFFKRSP